MSFYVASDRLPPIRSPRASSGSGKAAPGAGLAEQVSGLKASFLLFRLMERRYASTLPRRRPMFLPHCCPVCNDPTVTTTLQKYSVTAKVEGEDRDVSALAAYTCQNGHVFFLCRNDLVLA